MPVDHPCSVPGCPAWGVFGFSAPLTPEEIAEVTKVLAEVRKAVSLG